MLTKCAACGKAISDAAYACPHCGASTAASPITQPKATRSSTRIVWIACVVVLGVVAATAFAWQAGLLQAPMTLAMAQAPLPDLDSMSQAEIDEADYVEYRRALDGDEFDVAKAGAGIRADLAALYYAVNLDRSGDPRADPQLRQELARFQSALGHAGEGALTVAERSHLRRLAEVSRSPPIELPEAQVEPIVTDFGASVRGAFSYVDQDGQAYLDLLEVDCRRDEASCTVMIVEAVTPSLTRTGLAAFARPGPEIRAGLHYFDVTHWSASSVTARWPIEIMGRRLGAGCREVILTMNEPDARATLTLIDVSHCENGLDRGLFMRAAPMSVQLVGTSEVVGAFYRQTFEEIERHHGSLADNLYQRPYFQGCNC